MSYLIKSSMILGNLGSRLLGYVLPTLYKSILKCDPGSLPIYGCIKCGDGDLALHKQECFVSRFLH